MHHGTPSSGLLYDVHAALAADQGIRLIGYDRPGYGGSTRAPGRRVVDCVADVHAIADGLGLDRFATWGISGGGPHALACAALCDERLVATASLAAVAPYEADGLDWLEGMGESNHAEFGKVLDGEDAAARVPRGRCRGDDGREPGRARHRVGRRCSGRGSSGPQRSVRRTTCSKAAATASRPASTAGSTTTSRLPPAGASTSRLDRNPVLIAPRRRRPLRPRLPRPLARRPHPGRGGPHRRTRRASDADRASYARSQRMAARRTARERGQREPAQGDPGRRLSRRVQALVRRHGMRLGAARFVAGETLDECVAVLRRLNEQGLDANTTLLGEGVLEPGETEAVVAAYRTVLDRIASEGLRANVALKLTHLGLEIDEELAYANIATLLEQGSFIRIDMEQSQFVDAHAPDLPAAARGGLRQRRHRPPGLPLPHAGRSRVAARPRAEPAPRQGRVPRTGVGRLPPQGRRGRGLRAPHGAHARAVRPHGRWPRTTSR